MLKSPVVLTVDEPHLMQNKPFRAIFSLADAAKDGRTNFAFILAAPPLGDYRSTCERCILPISTEPLVYVSIDWTLSQLELPC